MDPITKIYQHLHACKYLDPCMRSHMHTHMPNLVLKVIKKRGWNSMCNTFENTFEGFKTQFEDTWRYLFTALRGASTSLALKFMQLRFFCFVCVLQRREIPTLVFLHCIWHFTFKFLCIKIKPFVSGFAGASHEFTNGWLFLSSHKHLKQIESPNYERALYSLELIIII